MKNILIPTDFSDCANNAFEYALEFYKNEKNARITLMHVYHFPIVGDYVPKEMVEALHQKKKEEALVLFKEMFSKYTTGIKLNYELVEGFPIDVIEDKSASYDIVMMGTQGTTNSTQKLIGTVTSTCIGRLRATMIAVPAKAKFKGTGNIAYATDFNFLDEQNIESLLAMPGLKDAHLYCVNVLTEPVPVNAGAELELPMNRSRLTFNMINNPSIQEGLDEFVRDHDVELLSMYSKKHVPWWGGYVLNSETREMSFHTEVPLVIFQD